ncbi:MAG: hypothetical protein FJ125_03160, partial [Deltaproteobacteria bacterium]|nr:hypothetical protein [Deltaproteobacteria bacterium]
MGGRPMVKAAPWWLLLWPRWRTVLNGPVAASSRRRLAGVLFGLLGLAFWAAIFFSAWWFFHRCLGVELVGPLLVRKVLDMAFLVFLSVLLFSNLIAAFSTFFLADDLTMLAALPVHVDRLYLSRLGETSLHSSWTILIFGLPILAAAGLVFDAGAGYYVLAALVLPPFLILPAVLGSAVTLLLVLVFPARRARDLLLLLGLVAFCVLFVLFRLLQPERLLDDGQFGDLVSFLATFQTPQAEWLPSAWLVRAIFPALRGQPPWDGEAAGLADLGMLFLSAAAVLVLGTWLNRPLYRKAYSRSLEGNGRPIGCGGLVL